MYSTDIHTIDRQIAGNAGDANQRVQVVDTNALRHLPAELILEIAEHLGLADLLCFRATYYCYRDLVDSIKQKHLAQTIFDPSAFFIPTSVEDLIQVHNPCDEFAVRFHHERFQWMAALELRTCSEFKSKVLCSYCLDLHPTSSFSSKELEKRTTERVCVCANVRFHICSHKSLNFAQLMASKPLDWEDYPWEEQTLRGEAGFTPFLLGSWDDCNVALARTIEINLPGSMGKMVMSKSLDHSAHSLCCLSLMRIDHDFVRLAFEALDLYICPHLRTSSPEVFEYFEHSLQENYWSWEQTYETVDKKDRFWPLGDLALHCEAEQCAAQFRIDPRGAPHNITVYTDRRVSRCTVVDMEWLAKVEVAGG